jgi:EpsI family protein
MVVGYYTKMESSLITKHILLGWIIYGIGIFIFLYFYSGLKFKRVPSKETVTGEHGKKRFLARYPFVVQLLLIVLVIFPSLLTYVITEHINGQPVRPVRLQLVADTWKQSSGDIPFNWKPDFPVPDSRYTGTYRNKQDAVYVNILNYQHLKAGVEPLNMDNRPYNRGGWSLLRHKVVTLKHGKKRQMHANLDVIISRSGDRMIVLNYYLINGKVAINLVRAKFYTLLGMLHFINDIKVVCLATKQEPGETSDSAYLRLRNFIQSSNLN